MQPTNSLQVAGVARNAAVETYRLTAKFPTHERFGLTSQMRRAAVSIGSNIAEGCGRQGPRALSSFLSIAMGSASELQFQCELSVALGMCTEDDAAACMVEVTRAKKMLSGLIKKLAAA